MPRHTFDSPRLLADVGGTYARFALEVAPGVFEQKRSLRCAEYSDFQATISAYLSALSATNIRSGAVAIASPIAGDQVRMTNLDWQFSIATMRERLHFDDLLVINDFAALAMALPTLRPHQRRQVGGGEPVVGSVSGVIGAGSGLGASGLVPSDHTWIALNSEGGHASYSPRNEREMQILQYAWRQFPHVSFERLLSGPGIELIHRALADRSGLVDQTVTAPEITRRALEEKDPLCVETVDTFCAILGTAAANLAVTLGASGGIYIGGGIVPRLGEYFDRSGFRSRFEDMGRYSDYTKAIPTYVITEEDATLIGAAAALSAQLNGPKSAESSLTPNRLTHSRRGGPRGPS